MTSFRDRVTCVAEIPFPRLEPPVLFDMRGEHDPPQPPNYDYFGFGWALIDELVLESHAGVRVTRTLRDTVVVLAHAFDEQPEPARGEIDLGFWFDEDEWYEPDDPDDHDFVIVAPLTVFVREHVPRILAELGRDDPDGWPQVVLAVCNPGKVEWQPPANERLPPLWLASDVARWSCVPASSHAQGFTLRLDAPSWRRLA